MSLFGEWYRRVHYLWHRSELEADLESDMLAHRSQLSAPVRFGSMLRLREDARDVWGWQQLDAIVRDVRLGTRALRRSRGFTVAVVTSLSLGLSLFLATLTVVDAYLLRSMPYRTADRLFHVVYGPPGAEPRGASAIDWRALDDVVDMADDSSVTRLYLSDRGYAEELIGLQAAQPSLESLNVTAMIGRSLQAPDFERGAPQVAVISHALWLQRFGGTPVALGSSFLASAGDQTAAAARYQVVGVLPEGFRYARDFARRIDIVVPLRARQRAYMVRLREGASPEEAADRITVAIRSAGSSLPPNWTGVRLEAVHQRYVAGLRPILIPVVLAAMLVLLVVTANLAVLSVLRVSRRRAELELRVALGAARTHLFRMQFIEVGLLCALAMAAALVLTFGALSLLGHTIEAQLGRPPIGDSSVLTNGRVWTLAVAISVAMWCVLSAISSISSAAQLRLSRTTAAVSGRMTDGPRAGRARAMLMALEVAASLALLVGTGLMIRSAVNAMHTDFGFDMHHVTRLRLALPGSTYPDPPARVAFYQRLSESLHDAPTFELALTNAPPFFQPPLQPVAVAGRDVEERAAAVNAVSGGYFSTLRIPVLDGREFEPVDRMGSEPVAVISDSVARGLWPHERAIGKSIRTVDSLGGRQLGLSRRIVGVVRDVRQSLDDADQRDIYIPLYQAPAQYVPVFIRSERPPEFWTSHLRNVVATIDATVLVGEGQSLEDEYSAGTAGNRVLTTALASFTAFAFLLALMGTYGVTAYGIQLRRREIAIRLALGATPRQVDVMLLSIVGRVVLWGLLMGIPAALIVGRLLRASLYGLTPIDGPTIIVAVAVLSAAVLAASWLPARRVTASNPVQELNQS